MLYVIAVWFSLIVQLQNTGVKCLCSVQDNQKQYRFGAKVAAGPGWASVWRAPWSGHSCGIISLNCCPRPQTICLCLKQPQTGFCQSLCIVVFGCQCVVVVMAMIVCVHKSIWSVQWCTMVGHGSAPLHLASCKCSLHHGIERASKWPHGPVCDAQNTQSTYFSSISYTYTRSIV